MKLAELVQGWETRSTEEAVSEVERELQVRERCFTRWVEEGRITRVDARDRIQRLTKAVELLKASQARGDAFEESANTGPSMPHAKVDQTNDKKSEKAVDDVPF